MVPQHDEICRAAASVPLTQTVAFRLLFFSDIHHLNGDRDPAQRRHAAAGQSGDLPGDQPVLLPPPGPQAQEDVSRPRRLWGGGADRAQSATNSWGIEGCGGSFVRGFGGQPATACREQAQFSDVEHGHV